jgi:hypothetical protein
MFSCGVIISGLLLIWVSTFQIPSLDTIEERKVSQSTKKHKNKERASPLSKSSHDLECDKQRVRCPV